jgi:poly-gamma-glutamate synthesis protein (capsule biosynthesis protein)
MGTDLLYGTGTFEPMEISRRAANVPLWSLGKYGSVASDAACGPMSADGSSGSGLLLARSPLSTRTAFASPDHRTAVSPRQKLSVLASLRRASEGSQLRVHWFKAASGGSASVSSIELPVGSWDRDSCRRIRFDVTVPPGAVAAQVFVRLKPPAGGQRVRRLAVDNVSLVDWAPSGRAGRRYGVFEVLKDGSVPFSSDDNGVASASPLVPVSNP